MTIEQGTTDQARQINLARPISSPANAVSGQLFGGHSFHESMSYGLVPVVFRSGICVDLTTFLAWSSTGVLSTILLHARISTIRYPGQVKSSNPTPIFITRIHTPYHRPSFTFSGLCLRLAEPVAELASEYHWVTRLGTLGDKWVETVPGRVSSPLLFASFYISLCTRFNA